MKKAFFTLLFLSFLILPVRADNATFSSPVEGELWVRGTDRTITYTFSQEISWYVLALFHNGTKVGTFSLHHYTYPPGVYNQPWKVGYIEEAADLVPPGSGYQIGFECGDAPCPIGLSKKFTIGYDFTLLEKIKRISYAWLPRPGDCPQCIFLDLSALREALAQIHEPVAAGLYWRKMMVTNLGQVGGSGPAFVTKLQVKLGPEALAALNRGDEFELLVLNGRNHLIRSQAVRLVAAGLGAPRMEPVLKR